MKSRFLFGLKSFTLLELIISLVISSVLISGAFVILGFTNQFLVDYRKSHELVNDLVLFTRYINQDLFYAREIKATSDYELEIIQDDKTVYFSVLKDCVVREDGFSTDTLEVRVFEHELSVGSDWDYLNIFVSLDRDTLPLFFKVWKSSRTLVNKNY